MAEGRSSAGKHNGELENVSQVKAYPQALQLSQGIHHLCSCLKSADWPYCKNEDAACETRRHTLELSKPRFVWLCQCAASGEMPFCDGEGHIAVEKRQR